MKPWIQFLMALAMGVLLTASPAYAAGGSAAHNMRIAMISDHGGITDQSFNQSIYESCRFFAQGHGTPFACFQPLEDNNEARVAAIRDAVKQGYNVIVTAGDSFVDALKSTAQGNPKARFVAVDVSRERLGNYDLPENFYGVVYKEELSGYMAGYAAVRLGYTKLGYLGGTDIPPVRRYGYGFVQGIDDAAKELRLKGVTVHYAYAGQFEPSAEINEAVDQWYQDGVQIVLPCGGLYESAAEAAEARGGKIIGIDVDQSGVIDSQYGKGMTVTSAMKDLSGTVQVTLGKIADGSFRGGKIETLGLISEDPMKNYVKLPMGTTQWSQAFSLIDYRTLVSKMYRGDVKISDDISKKPGDYATSIQIIYSDDVTRMF